MTQELDNILSQASEMFFALGVRSVSMDDISRSLGMSKKTLYQHFASKEELVNHTINKFIEEEKSLLVHFRTESNDALDEMIQIGRYAVTIFSKVKPILLHDLQKYYGSVWGMIQRMQSDTVAKAIEANILRGQKESIYRNDLNVSIVTQLYVQKSMSLTSAKVFANGDYNRQELVEQHILYHLHGILSESGRQLLKNIKPFE